MTAPSQPTPPAAPREATPAGARKRRTWLWLAGVILLAAGGLAAWWWRPRTPPPPEPPMLAEIADAETRHMIEAARQKVREDPHSAAAWGKLGMVLEAQLYEAEAEPCFAEAARLDPSDVRWPYFRGLYALKFTPDEALPFLRQAANTPAPERYRSVVHLRLAEVLFEQGELDEAEKLFRAEWQPGKTPRAAFGLGLVALRRGDNDAARSFFLVARASPHVRKAATAQLAALARREGDEKAAAAHEQEAATLPPDTPWPDPLVETILRLQVGPRSDSRDAGQLEREQRFAEAADFWLRQLQTRPTIEARLRAGLNLARLGDYERALPLVREAIRQDPDNAGAQYTLAVVLFGRAETEEARAPGSAEVKEGFREAAEHAEQAIRIKPDHGQAYLYWGLALKHLGKPADAVPVLRRGIACHPESLDLHLALGRCLIDAGRPDEAAVHLEDARRLNPKDPRVTDALRRLHPDRK